MSPVLEEEHPWECPGCGAMISAASSHDMGCEYEDMVLIGTSGEERDDPGVSLYESVDDLLAAEDGE